MAHAVERKGPPTEPPADLATVKIQETNFLVPAKVVPGKTRLEVRIDEFDTLLMTVPPGAVPGDRLTARKICTGSKSDKWECCLVRTKTHFGKGREPMDAIANIPPLRAPAGDGDAVYEQLVASLRAAGGYVNDKVARGCVPPLCIPGIVARNPLEAGEIIFRVPVRLHLSPSMVERVAPDFHKALVGLGQESAGVFHIFLAWLLVSSEDRAVARQAGGGNSDGPWPGINTDSDVWEVWERYADGLVGEDFAYHPYRTAAADPEGLRKKLEPCAETEFLLDRVSDLIETHRTICSTRPSQTMALAQRRLPLEMFFRAKLSLISRVFLTDDESALVPGIDLINHASGTDAGVEWRWDGVAREMTARTCRPHQAGEELFQSYGDRSNLLLYRTYGFTQVPEVEPSWSYVVQPQCAFHIYEDFLPGSQSGLAIMLDSARMDETLCKALNTVSARRCDPGEFLRLVCARCLWAYDADAMLKPALQALQQARTTNPSSCNWWLGLAGTVEGQRLAEDVGVRLKMCEYLCLVAHLEAVDAAAGRLPEDQCLERCEQLRMVVRDGLSTLREGSAFTLSLKVLGSD